MIKRRRSSYNFEDEENFRVLQHLLYIFNCIFLLVGAMIFAAGLYINFSNKMMKYLGALDMHFFLIGTDILLSAACFVMLNSFIGCCAAAFLSRRSLKIYMVISIITFGLLLGGSIYMLKNGLEGSNLYPYIQVTMRKYIYEYQWNVDARRRVDIIQEFIGCCGGFSFRDYIYSHIPIPNTCRNHVTGNQYIDSCAETFSQWLERRTGWICGMSLCLSFCQIIAVILAVLAYIHIDRMNKTL